MTGPAILTAIRAELEALIAGDGAALLAEVQRIAEFAPDFAMVLDELAGLVLERMADALVDDAHLEQLLGGGELLDGGDARRLLSARRQ